MGTTLWVLQKTRAEEGDDRDHSLFFRFYETLDVLAARLGVRKLSEFFDTADFRFNASNTPLPESSIAENQKWYSPSEAIPSLTALIGYLESTDEPAIPLERRADLLDELSDCLSKVEGSNTSGDVFHFSVVM